MTWAQDQRVAFIKQAIEAGENITRPEVASRFNCTNQTVTATFHEVKRRYPDLMEYDAKAKAYRRADLVSDLPWKDRALAAEAQVSALQAQVDGLREGIQRAEAWFRDYERQHRAKATPEGNLKADTNEERANYLRALLPQPPADEPAKGGEGL